MTNKELRKEWENRIAAFKASGQSTTEWCQTHNLKVNRLRYWLRKLRLEDASANNAGTSPQWLSVEIDNQEVCSCPNNSLVVRVGQATIEVTPGFDPALFSDVVKALTDL